MGSFFRHLTVLLAAGALAWPGPPRAGAAEKKDTRPVLDPPPPALPQAVTVARNRRTDIPLKIYGVQNEPLRYLIKTPPAHGKLSDLRSVSREVSMVTYQAPEDLSVTADRFTFSVQSHAGVSAPVAVTISIVDEPSRLSVAFDVDFGDVLAGSTVMKEVEVANRGGGYIEGEVQVDSPFKVEGRRTYRLQAGDYTYFKIVFAPSEGGVFRREIRYTSDKEFITTLTGSAQTPISAEPPRIELRHAPDSAVRTGAFEIANRTGDARRFTLAGGARLQLPESVSVEAHGRAAIAVSTRPEDVTDLDEEVRVEAPGFALRVPVRAVKVGPILRVVQRSLALGRVDATRGTQAAVELENVGGTSAHVTAEIGAPFALAQSAFDLVPGEKKVLALYVRPGEPRRYRTWLRFKGGPTNAEVEVDAELFGDSTASRSEPDESTRAAPRVNPAELPPWEPDLNIAKAIRVTGVTATTATIEWPADLDGSARYRTDRLILTRDSLKELRNAWIEIPGTTFNKQGPLWVAHLVGLHPAQSQTVRVVPLNSEGKLGESLFRLDFYTPSAPSFPKPRAVPVLLIGLILVLGAVFWKRVRRHLSEPVSGF